MVKVKSTYAKNVNKNGIQLVDAIIRSNMYENVKVIIFFSKFWGLIPYSKYGTKCGKICLFAYSLLLTVCYFYVCFSFNVFAFQKINEAATSVKLLIKILYVKTTLQCILLLTVLTINMIKSKRFLLILEKLENFDTMMMKKLNVKLPMRNNIIFQLAYGVYIIFFCVYHCMELYIARNGALLSIEWAWLCNINLIILFQFTIMIHALNVRFKTFNSFLVNMNMFTKFNIAELKTYFNYGYVNAPRYRNLNILNQFKLKELHIIYLSIRDLLYDINSYYSFQILLIVCETFVILIASISSFTFNITADVSFLDPEQKNLTLIHCGLRLLTVTVLIHVAEQASNEANSTVTIIHNFIKNEQNPEIKKGLELFLLDLWHHKIKFDAHGFFNLDYGLIQSILSAATTYVIVLIQFQLATTSISSKNTTPSTS